MRVRVPKAVVQNSYEAFPEGHYEGIISGADVADPNNDQSWLLLKLSVSDITPREGTADPGRSAFSGDITLRNTDRDTGDVIDVREISDLNGSTPFSIRRAAGLLSGVAAAVEVGDVADNGDVEVDLSQVAEALVDGDFEGQKVAFAVSHYTNRKGDTIDQFDVIGPA